MDKVRAALLSTIESLRMLRNNMPNSVARNMVDGFFQGVDKQLQEALEQLDSGIAYIICCNDGTESVTFDRQLAELEVKKLKKAYDKQWVGRELHKPFVYYHVHDVPMLKGVSHVRNEENG